LVVPAGAAVPQQPVSQESQQLLLRRNLLQSRFRIPSSQPQSPQPPLEPQLVPQPVLQLERQLVPHCEAPQVSQPQPEERNRPNSRLRQDSRPHESQLVEQQEVDVVQAGADVVQAGAHVLHESHPQSECLNRFNRRLRQLSLSQPQPLSQPLQPPQDDEAAAGAAGAGAAFAAESAGSAPANQAVVTSTNAAFTRCPPNLITAQGGPD
jgi:hypothetical protein